MMGFVRVSCLLMGCGLLAIAPNGAHGQAEITARGNVKGIRIEGQLMKCPTSICLIGPSLMDVRETGRDDQGAIYKRDGDSQVVTCELSHCSLTETLRDSVDHAAVLGVDVQPAADSTLTGIFLCSELPADDFEGAAIHLIDSAASTMPPVPLFPGRRGRTPGFLRAGNGFIQASARGIRVSVRGEAFDITTDRPTEVLFIKGNMRFGNPNDRIYLGIVTGATAEGQRAARRFVIRASGAIDRTPAHIVINARNPGRDFDGIGGNFRLQNDSLDPKVIDYCLDKLNVRWARVEMPWRSWQPVEEADPLKRARAGKIDEGVRNAMAMAQRLAKRHIPLIVSAWSAPSWAIDGPFNFRNENGIWGNPLNPTAMRSIVRSLGDYFVYLKEAYGVEPDLFSFNESDLGIYVRMTGREHADFIKKLGAYFASRQLRTRMLLGDNSNATTIDFIEPALEDPATHEYIGAISFHAWQGCNDWTLANWGDAARELNVPLLIAEGGIDPQAYQYPTMFLEPSFAMEEIDTYIRSIAVAHVQSILQWQLTADYSLLLGGGIYRTGGGLRPTQRFWNLKQLGTIPRGAFILPAECDKDAISCAALGDIADGTYVVHMVNNGASRPVTLEGLPPSAKEIRLYVTDAKRGMNEERHVPVENGSASFTLDAFAFTSAMIGG